MSKYDENNEIRCSFCGSPQSQVKRLIAGRDVYICNECVDLCQDIIAEGLAESMEAEAVTDDTKLPDTTGNCRPFVGVRYWSGTS